MDFGSAILVWRDFSHIHYHKGRAWYIVFGSILLTIVVYGVLTDSITMSIAFLTLGGLYFLLHRKEPKTIEYQLTTLGILRDTEFIPYSDISSFYIIHNPPYFSQLFIRTKKTGFGEISLQIRTVSPTDVREILFHQGILELSGQKEPLYSIIGRMLAL